MTDCYVMYNVHVHIHVHVQFHRIIRTEQNREKSNQFHCVVQRGWVWIFAVKAFDEWLSGKWRITKTALNSLVQWFSVVCVCVKCQNKRRTPKKEKLEGERKTQKKTNMSTNKYITKNDVRSLLSIHALPLLRLTTKMQYM